MTACVFGLRCNETRMLDAVGFGHNIHGTEFGEYGLCRVRFSKAMKGSPPKQRSVLTVWNWMPDILDDWVASSTVAKLRPRPARILPDE